MTDICVRNITSLVELVFQLGKVFFSIFLLSDETLYSNSHYIMKHILMEDETWIYV